MARNFGHELSFRNRAEYVGTCSAFLIKAKMALDRGSRNHQSAGFFRDLNSLSTADFVDRQKGRNRRQPLESGRFFEVERVITSRKTKSVNSYIVFYS